MGKFTNTAKATKASEKAVAKAAKESEKAVVKAAKASKKAEHTKKMAKKALIMDIKGLENSTVKDKEKKFEEVFEEEYVNGRREGIPGHTKPYEYNIDVLNGQRATGESDDNEEAEANFDGGDTYTTEVRTGIRYFLQKVGMFEGSNIVHGKRISPRTRTLSGESFHHYHFNSEKPLETPYEGHVPGDV